MIDDIIQLIRKGITATDFFLYNGTPIQFRPLTTSEFDDAKYKALNLCDSRLCGTILKIRLGKIDETLDLTSIPPELMINYIKYLLESDYWIVFHAMKDFRGEDFAIGDVKKMQHVHEFVHAIIKASSLVTEIIQEVVKTPEGQELAKIIYEFKQPLVSDLWKLTPLQHDFLKWSSPNAPKLVARSIDELGKVLPQIGDAIGHARR